jgi:hypothetical protein
VIGESTKAASVIGTLRPWNRVSAMMPTGTVEAFEWDILNLHMGMYTFHNGTGLFS